MNDDIERRLCQLTPRGAPPELRPRVLDAVAVHLQRFTPPSSRRAFRPALAVAVVALASLALNVWVNDTLDRRLTMVLGPPPVSRQAAEIAAEVASITDPATGRWAYDRLAASRPHGDDGRQYAARLQQLIREFTVDLKGTADEATQKNPQIRMDRRGSRDRHPVAGQCLLCVEHRYTA